MRYLSWSSALGLSVQFVILVLFQIILLWSWENVAGAGWLSQLSPPGTVECPTLVHTGQIGTAAAAALDLVTGLNRF